MWEHLPSTGDDSVRPKTTSSSMGRGRGKRSQSQMQSTQDLPLEMFEEQRKEHLSKMALNIRESKAEKAKNIKEKLEREKLKVGVCPHKQPPRQAVADTAAAAAAIAAAADAEASDYIHSDSEDMGSDYSTDSVDFSKVCNELGAMVTDSEFQDFHSGLDLDEFREKVKKKRKRIRKPRTEAPHGLERYKSIDRVSQQCVIQAQEVEDAAALEVKEDGGSSGSCRGL